MSPTDETDWMEQATQALANDDAHAALSALRALFRIPGLQQRRAELVEALGVLERVIASYGEQALESAITVAKNEPDSPEALHELGFELVEHGLPEIAISVLTRCHALAPGEESVVTELVAALEADGRNAEACAVLRKEEALCRQSFLCRYLLAFNSVLSADLATAAELAPSLQGGTDEDESFMCRRIRQMLWRAELAAHAGELGKQDLRGWHFVVTGGILLNLSPFGFDEGMNGRFAFLQDSESRCRLGLERLGAVLDKWGKRPSRILMPPDRDSRILSLAAGKILRLPVQEFAPSAPGLVITYDLKALDQATLEDVNEHHPGQILFAHATCWTEPPACSADLTTYLYQMQYSPWGERFSGQPGDVLPPDEAPVEEIAERIVAAPALTDLLETDGQADVLEFSEHVFPAAAALTAAGRRSPLWEGSPVKSSRFA